MYVSAQNSGRTSVNIRSNRVCDRATCTIAGHLFRPLREHWGASITDMKFSSCLF